MAKVIELADGKDFTFIKPSEAMAKRFISPFVLIRTELNREVMEKLLACEDFDCIEIVGLDINSDSVDLAAFYKV